MTTIKTNREILETRSKVTPTIHHQEGDSECWPPEDYTALNHVEGNLAKRVRNRLGVEDETAPVYIEETTQYGGYSEYTQENYTSFTIHCAGYAVFVKDETNETEWDSLYHNATVFAKLQIWLLVGETPSKLWKDSIIFEEKAVTANVSIPRWRVKRDSMLASVMADYNRTTLSFGKLSDDCWGFIEEFTNSNDRKYTSLRVSSDLDIDKLSTKKVILETLAIKRCVTIEKTSLEISELIEQASQLRLMEE